MPWLLEETGNSADLSPKETSAGGAAQDQHVGFPCSSPESTCECGRKWDLKSVHKTIKSITGWEWPLITQGLSQPFVCAEAVAEGVTSRVESLLNPFWQPGGLRFQSQVTPFSLSSFDCRLRSYCRKQRGGGGGAGIMNINELNPLAWGWAGAGMKRR